MKHIVLVLSILMSGFSFGQIVNIPDVNFKNALLNHFPVIDINNDGEIQISEAIAYTGTLNVENQNIADMTGIEAFVNITFLRCSNNQITQLDISNNTNLNTLYANVNQLTSFDASNNLNLINLNLSNNLLTQLNIANGNNSNLTTLNINNYELFCVKVDASVIGNIPPGWFYSPWTAFDAQCTNDIIYIADANFKNALLNHFPVIDTNGDGEIQVAEAANFTGTLDVSNQGINSLGGIYGFTNITGLNCSNNNLNHLYLNHNPNLIELDFSYNNLTNAYLNYYGLDLDNNILLEKINCNQNSLQAIDLSNKPHLKEFRAVYNSLGFLSFSNSADIEVINVYGNASLIVVGITQSYNLTFLDISQTGMGQIDVSNYPNLVHLGVGSNYISQIDVSNNINLETLLLFNTSISQIDVSNNINLKHLNIGTTQISSIDLTNNIYLEELYCLQTQITELDLTNNLNLWGLHCDYTPITELDLSNNQNLTHLIAQHSNLSILNVANGNNSNLLLRTVGNPNLICVEIDSDIVGDIPSPWTYDSWTNFSADCMVLIPDINFLNALLNHNPVIDLNGDGEIHVSEASSFTGTLSVNNKDITDLTGIETFKNLTGLDCFNNEIVSLDLSENMALNSLNCSSNLLEQLNLKNENNPLNLNDFNSSNNPNLFCVQVNPDLIDSIPGDWQYDSWTVFNDDCNYMDVQNNHLFFVRIYPNPTTDIIFIGNTSVAAYEIYNLTGKQLLKGNGTQINVQSLASGVYLLKVISDFGIGYHKIIKR